MMSIKTTTAAMILTLSAATANAGCPTTNNVDQFCEYGHSIIEAAAPNCLKLHIYETGDKYAVTYIIPATLADLHEAIAEIAKVNIFSDNVGVAIVTDGQQSPTCGDGSYYNVIVVYPDPYYP
jgi:hypothetical protein